MKVAIAMSGGVDSSVAARILKDEGHDVVGLFLKLWSDPTCTIKGENRCCDYEALDDARAVAAKLNIPFYVINARDEFKAEVVDYFLNEYKNLRTPNPCVVCNDKIKFGLLLKRALEIGCDYLATGHYARISNVISTESPSGEIFKKISRRALLARDDKNNEAGVFKLLAGIDKTKDQSYMLYHLSQKQLSRILFPLGEMNKKEVRALASKWDLPVKEKPESQEICFFGDKDYRDFLKRYLPKKYFKPGEIVDRDGNILGEHQGLINYTIGQRKGVEQNQKSKIKNQNDNSKYKIGCHSEPEQSPEGGPLGCGEESHNKIPLYVIGFDVKNNQLIVGEDKEVYKKEMIATEVNWIDPSVMKSRCFDRDPDISESSGLKVKIRYRHEAVGCSICHPEPRRGPSGPSEGSIARDSSALPQNNNQLRILFKKPQRAVTPGQSAVFYLGDEVLGGGIIAC